MSSIFGPRVPVPDEVMVLFKDQAVLVDPAIEGQQIDKAGNVVIGTRSGPVYTIAALLHEMCHFVEIDEERMNTPRWGLGYSESCWFSTPWDNYRAGFYEPKTIIGLKREIRVHAYQYGLTDYVRATNEVFEDIEALEYLSDYPNIPIFVPDFKKRYGKNYDKSRKAWLHDQLNELIKLPQYSAETFLAEWYRRNAILKAKKSQF